MATSRKHAKHAAWVLDHADDTVTARDRRQASENIRRSVAHTVKQIAERHGWPHKSKADLSNTVSYLADATGDDTIREKYERARSFLTNFYEDEYPMENIERGVSMAKGFAAQLRQASQRVKDGARPPNGANSPLEYRLLTERDSTNRDATDLDLAGLIREKINEAYTSLSDAHDSLTIILSGVPSGEDHDAATEAATLAEKAMDALDKVLWSPRPLAHIANQGGEALCGAERVESISIEHQQLVERGQ